MRKNFDVIIIGAGPAGSSCAYRLKRLNSDLKILLLDKASFPRYKPCGGGISPEVQAYLDLDLSASINFQCNKVAMIVGGRILQQAIDPIYMVRREVFDYSLVKHAIAHGVTFLDNTKVLEIQPTSLHNVVVHTQDMQYTATYALLAEGSCGKLAKKLQIYPKKSSLFAALEYEHCQAGVDGMLSISLDACVGGYAWNFPKSDGLSLGIGARIKGKDKNAHGLPQQLRQYLQPIVNNIDRANLHGHPILTYAGRNTLVHNNILLIGEIAGCVDPLTAEGIRPAIKSGYLAAQVLAETFQQQNWQHVKRYDTLFHKEIGKDLQYARFFAYLLYNHSEKILPFIGTEHAVRQFMRVFTGQSTYKKHVLKVIRHIL